MNLQIEGHVALVQAASKGIGRGIAESLAAEGCDLIITARHEKELKDAAYEIQAKHGRRVLALACDSSDLHDNERLAGRALADYGRLDIIVCNSGGPPAGGLLDLTPEQWRDAAELLVVAPAHLLRTALPLLEQSPAARFFIVTSSSTREPLNGLTLSNTYRPGIVGLVKSLAQELSHKGVRCHCISPGRIDTARLGKVIEMQAQRTSKEPEEIRHAMLSSIPAGRLGQPKDLGTLVAFLSSPLAEYLNGGNWLVDGGLIKSL